MSTVTIASSVSLIIGTNAQGDPIKLNGPPAPASGLNLGHNAGYGLTEVDEALFNNWANGPGTAIVASGAVYEAS